MVNGSLTQISTPNSHFDEELQTYQKLNQIVAESLDSFSSL